MVALLFVAVFATPPPTPRARAAYGMVLYLRDYARNLVRMDAGKGQFSKNGCPTGIGWVTWGMAKTDPWGSSFMLRCTPSIEIGSPGPDRKIGTADDVWSDKPLVDAAGACPSACRKARACGRGAEKWCADACRSATSSETAFYADTCALVESCDCLATAASGRMPEASCADFGKLASRAVARPKTAAALTAECERDLLRAHELVCVAASSTAAELVRCFLTVNRDNVERILTD